MEITDALSELEKKQLAQHELTIQVGLKTFYDVGEALIGIRDGRLYRETYNTFEAYCKNKWQMERAHAYRLIDAAQVVDNVSPNGGQMPINERQARPLTTLSPDDQRTVWEAVTTNEDNITAKVVESYAKVQKVAPAPLAERVMEGALAPQTALELTREIAKAPEAVKEVVLETKVSDPALVPALTELYEKKREAFTVIVASGALDGEIPMEKATVRDLERHLEVASEEHRQQAIAEKRRERVLRIAEIAENSAPLPDDIGKFPVILADPPWQYDYSLSDSRQIENHYPTMTLEAICALPVCELATDDAVLFMWTTSPKLAESIQVVAAWGFTYKTCMVWVKDKIGMGYYARQKHELLLIATRGNIPTPEPANRPPSVIEAARGKHSEKPDEFYQAIEAMYPEYKRIELFSRNVRNGWNGWGNQYEQTAA